MTSDQRIELHAPSEWDVVLSPELAPLFVLDAALVAAQRFFSILLDPSSAGPGGANYPPTRLLLGAMYTLRCLIREHRITEEAFADDHGAVPSTSATDDEIPDEEAAGSLF
jgi:hypothetical protein